MTPRKPKEVTAPALPADEAFGNLITAERDAAVVKLEALRSQRIARKSQYERDLARLEHNFQTDDSSLSTQIGEQENILAGADASLEAMQARAAE